jgi:hypothetical protein
MKKTTLPKSAPLKPEPETAAQPIRRGPQVMTPATYDDDKEPDLEGQAKAREKAFSAGYSFAGQKLLPFSSSRERLLMDIREASGAGDFGRLGMLYPDALRFVWLCLHTGEELEQFQCGVGLPGLNSWPLYRRFQVAIDRWTDQNAALVKKHKNEMIDTFLDAWKASQVTHAVPESADHNREDEDAGN